MRLSRNFTLDELTLSGYAERNGLDNTPSLEEIKNLKLLCLNVLQPLRDVLKRPVVVTSGYRSPEVNRGIHGSPSSQHMRGEAADIIVPGVRATEVFEIIARSRLPYDQLIEEFGRWVHVSYTSNGRRQVLVATRVKGETKYTPVQA